jgi:nucleoside-diphosphate-sugar epimerase
LLAVSNLKTTIFRPSVIFGPGDEFINMIAGFLKRFSVMPVIGDGEYRLQPVHIDDLCAVVTKSIDDRFAFGEIFDIGGPEIMTFNELVDTVADALDKKCRKFHQPVFFMRILAAVFGRFSWFPVTREQISMLYAENYTYDSRLFDRYGITPKKLADSIRDYL